MADAPDPKSGGGNIVGVQVPLPAPIFCPNGGMADTYALGAYAQAWGFKSLFGHHFLLDKF